MGAPQPTPPPNPSRRQRVLVSRALPRGFVILGTEEVVIGRGRECQVVLLADEISRRHARIAWEGGAHNVADLGSANGTFVNGDQVERARKLDHDDLISVGPFRLRYLLVEGSKEDLATRFDPRISDTTRQMKGPKAGTAQLAGKFSGNVLLEACQLIELSKRTGELKVEAGGLVGRLRFKEGLIVDAKVGIEVGEKAARRVLGFRKGEYAFEATPTGGTVPMGPLSLKVSALAMDILRAHDETLEKTRRLDSEFADEAGG